MEEACSVCGQPLDEENVARCLNCQGRFHLAWSQDAEVPQCGGWVMLPGVCGLAFVCRTCQEAGALPQQPQGGP